jgi:hypothetical protein
VVDPNQEERFSQLERDVSQPRGEFAEVNGELRLLKRLFGI